MYLASNQDEFTVDFRSNVLICRNIFGHLIAATIHFCYKVRFLLMGMFSSGLRVREKSGKNKIFSRSGNCQGILKKCQGILPI